MSQNLVLFLVCHTEKFQGRSFNILHKKFLLSHSIFSLRVPSGAYLVLEATFCLIYLTPTWRKRNISQKLPKLATHQTDADSHMNLTIIGSELQTTLKTVSYSVSVQTCDLCICIFCIMSPPISNVPTHNQHAHNYIRAQRGRPGGLQGLRLG